MASASILIAQTSAAMAGTLRALPSLNTVASAESSCQAALFSASRRRTGVKGEVGPPSSRRGSFLESSFLGSRDVAPTSSDKGGPSKNEKLPVVPPTCVAGNVFERIGRVARSYVGAAGRAVEDPLRLLDSSVRDMETELRRVSRTVEQVEASMGELQRQETKAKRRAAAWRERAGRALTAGQEDLAREALLSCRDCEGAAKSFQEQAQKQRVAAQKLGEAAQLLEQRLAEAASRKGSLQARLQAANAARRVQELLQGLDTGSAVAAFDKAMAKVEEVELEAAAVTELAADDIEQRFSKLERLSDSGIDAQLAQLKEQVKSPSFFKPESQEAEASSPAWLQRKASDSYLPPLASRKSKSQKRVLRDVEVVGDEDVPQRFFQSERSAGGGEEEDEFDVWGGRWSRDSRNGQAFRPTQESMAAGFADLPWGRIAQVAVRLALAAFIGPFAFLPFGGYRTVPTRRMAPPLMGPMGMMPMPMGMPMTPFGLNGRGMMMGFGPRGPLIVRRYRGPFL